MKFTCTKENLSHALALVGGVANNRTNLPILSNIHFEAAESKVIVTATDLEVAMTVDVRAKVEETGTFTVPAKMLADYVRLLSGEQVEIGVDGNELLVKSGSASTKIKGAAADEFPVVPGVAGDHEYQIEAQTLRAALGKTMIAVARNEIRPELAGVYMGFFTERFNGLILAATDSYRLAEARIPVANGTDEWVGVLPAKAAQEMVHIISQVQDAPQGKVQLLFNENQVSMRYGNATMTGRLIEGRYPDYSQIIPEDFKSTATGPVAELVKHIKAAGLFTTSGVNAISFRFDTKVNTVAVESTSTQAGEHKSGVDADITGEDGSVVLNHQYVLQGLQQIGDSVEFCMNGSDAPCLFREVGNTEYLYMVMPIRQ